MQKYCMRLASPLHLPFHEAISHHCSNFPAYSKLVTKASASRNTAQQSKLPVSSTEPQTAMLPYPMRQDFFMPSGRQGKIYQAVTRLL